MLRQRLHRPAPQVDRRRQDLRRPRRPADRTARPGRRRPEDQRPPTWPTCRSSSTDVTAQRETVFKGETLRGLLLTSYGFSEFGTKAGQAATVAYLAAALLLLLAIAGFVHAFVTPKTKAFAVPEPAPTRE